MNKLVDRLRGQYAVGPDNVYGTRSFADFIPPISLEAADRIEELELALKTIKLDMELSMPTGHELSATWNLAKRALGDE